MGENREIDRLAMRGRPEGTPVMHQRWTNLLFLHWPLPVESLRPLVPDSLELDTFDGKAWIGLTPFHLEDLHPTALPAFPGLSAFEELNVRTYVIRDGVPGIWFFSLDASKLLPALAARIFFMLPYFHSRIRFSQAPARFSFQLRRAGAPRATFRGSWRVGERLRDPDVNSLAFFLVERYCAFTVEGRRSYQIRIYHSPWILEEALVESWESTMVQALGITDPPFQPLAHFSRTQDVDIWAPAEIGVRVPAE